MHEKEDFGFEDFESALFDDGYQTDGDDSVDDSDVTETKEDTQETGSDGEDGDESDDSDEEDDTDDSEEDDADVDDEGEEGNTDADNTFTIKVNKEERKVSLEEMTTLAQKGADYDRVKEQNTKHQQTISDLQSKLEGFSSNQNVLDILDTIAKRSNLTMDQLAESLYINFRKNGGASEDAAREELKSAKLEKELNSYKAKQTQQQEKETDAETRAKRDLEEFGREYPDVELSEELVEKLVPDIQKGMSLAASYRKYEKAQDAARIADLERKIAAKAQNDKNKKRSPGSQKDSGGRKSKSDYDEFERALFG
jgi:hypothetical protein